MLRPLVFFFVFFFPDLHPFPPLSRCVETKVLVDPRVNIALLRKMARDLLSVYSTEQKRGAVKLQALARGVGLRLRNARQRARSE